jgi:cytochrome c-type biogenesis protein CcmE
MSARLQRLLLILLYFIFLAVAIFLVLFNSKKNLIFFYTPSELIESNPLINETVRIGGFVKNNSLSLRGDNEYNFIITDSKEMINITYKGLLPDLFKEGQGAVIEGKLLKNNLVKATNVFAKHDENYIPATLKNQLKNSDYWREDYK